MKILSKIMKLIFFIGILAVSSRLLSESALGMETKMCLFAIIFSICSEVLYGRLKINVVIEMEKIPYNYKSELSDG